MTTLTRKLGSETLWLLCAALAVSIPWLAAALRTLLNSVQFSVFSVQ